MGAQFKQSVANVGLDPTHSGRDPGAEWNNEIWNQVSSVSEYALILAIISVESEWNPNAINPGDPSYGLMQVRYCEAGDRIGCPVPGVQPDQLLDPIGNLRVGVPFMRGLIRRFGSTSDAISAYNAGHVARAAGGGFSNQEYVNAVQTYWTFYLNHLQDGQESAHDGVVEVFDTVTGSGAPTPNPTADLPTTGLALGGLAALLLLGGFLTLRSHR